MSVAIGALGTIWKSRARKTGGTGKQNVGINQRIGLLKRENSLNTEEGAEILRRLAVILLPV